MPVMCWALLSSRSFSSIYSTQDKFSGAFTVLTSHMWKLTAAQLEKMSCHMVTDRVT